jgi:hypothetical protein
MGWKLHKGIPQEHNYQKKLERLRAQGLLQFTPGVHILDVCHDMWCGIYQGKRCDCDPDLNISTLRNTHPQG